MKAIAEVDTYANYADPNYGVNTIHVTIGKLELFFSYKTVIAFRTPETGLVLSKNIWGPTTGKHLNLISRTAKKIDRDAFERYLSEVLRSYRLI